MCGRSRSRVRWRKRLRRLIEESCRAGYGDLREWTHPRSVLGRNHNVEDGLKRLPFLFRAGKCESAYRLTAPRIHAVSNAIRTGGLHGVLPHQYGDLRFRFDVGLKTESARKPPLDHCYVAWEGAPTTEIMSLQEEIRRRPYKANRQDQRTLFAG
jgi:hypothetical protein